MEQHDGGDHATQPTAGLLRAAPATSPAAIRRRRLSASSAAARPVERCTRVSLRNRFSVAAPARDGRASSPSQRSTVTPAPVQPRVTTSTSSAAGRGRARPPAPPALWRPWRRRPRRGHRRGGARRDEHPVAERGHLVAVVSAARCDEQAGSHDRGHLPRRCAPRRRGRAAGRGLSAASSKRPAAARLAHPREQQRRRSRSTSPANAAATVCTASAYSSTPISCRRMATGTVPSRPARRRRNRVVAPIRGVQRRIGTTVVDRLGEQLRDATATTAGPRNGDPSVGGLATIDRRGKPLPGQAQEDAALGVLRAAG